MPRYTNFLLKSFREAFKTYLMTSFLRNMFLFLYGGAFTFYNIMITVLYEFYNRQHQIASIGLVLQF